MTVKLVRRQVSHQLPGFSPFASRLLAGRGITSIEEFDHALTGMLSPDQFMGMAEASWLLVNAILDEQRILIVGDFDADGATSCALLVSALRQMGARDVNFLVPDRFRYGYGLTPEIVDVAASHSPQLLITVDNGISSVAGVAHARSLGMSVLITDHHLPGDELPAADAIVNPNQHGCSFPSKAVAGVGVAFYLLVAARALLREKGHSAGDINLADWLDLVALGTIADVVPMDQNNRILVSEGLRRIRGGRSRPGIYALLDIARADTKTVTSQQLAFNVAPRLNAAGRLDDMAIGIQCLLAEEGEAGRLAHELDRLNEERKTLEREMRQQAEAYIERHRLTAPEGRVGIAMYSPDWHQGVVGIVASRVKERFGRPAIVFARGDEGELKGSGRSIPGLHLRDVLDSIAVRHPKLIKTFGGHAMAAGLTILEADLEAFANAFDDEARRWLSAEALTRTLVSDGELDALTLDTAREVFELAPWGQGFPEPLFDGMFEVLDQRIVGQRHLKLLLRPVDGVASVDAIYFNQDRLLERRQLRLAYRLDINRYRGRESVQLIVEAEVNLST